MWTMSDLSDEEFYESELDQSEFIYSSTNGLTTGFLSLYIGKNNKLLDRNNFTTCLGT